MLKFVRVPALAALVVSLPMVALAHAVLVASTPKAGEVVHARSLDVELRFNSRVDAPHCTLMLASAGGAAVSLPIGKQEQPNGFRSHADALRPGAYTLRWQALASDGHITRGEIPFRVE